MARGGWPGPSSGFWATGWLATTLGSYPHFQEPEVSCWGKYCLFDFNIVLWVLGALYLATCLWNWGEKGRLSNISSPTDLGGLDLVWLFVAVGSVLVLRFGGGIGALWENTFLLQVFPCFSATFSSWSWHQGS